MVKMLIYVFKCPRCGLVLISTSEREVAYRSKEHLRTHKISVTVEEVKQALLVREIEID